MHVWLVAAIVSASAPALSCLRATSPVPRLGRAQCCGTDALSADDFADELRRRGLQTALDTLGDDGPSAFKDPSKVIEYVMLQLQHRSSEGGLSEAFRFTCREPGKSSFVSGLPLSSKRVVRRRPQTLSSAARVRRRPSRVCCSRCSRVRGPCCYRAGAPPR